MNRTGKALLLLLTFVCVIVLIIFCVELLLINRDNDDPADSGPTAPAAETRPQEPDYPPPDDDNGNGDDDSYAPADEAPPTEIPEPIGTQFLIPVPGPGNMALILYVYEELFEHREEELSDIFTYTGAGNASLEIRMIQMQYGDDIFARDFLEESFDVPDSAVVGVRHVGTSPLEGILVMGQLDDEDFDVWIYSIPGTADLGLAFILRFENNIQRSALELIINTLYLVSGVQ